VKLLPQCRIPHGIFVCGEGWCAGVSTQGLTLARQVV
jgi:hypothetical protein